MLYLRCIVLLLLYGASCRLPREDAPGDRITRIGFGSCARQDEAQPIWDEVLASDPDIFVLMGDNVYADTEDMALMRRVYQRFAAIPGFKKLREKTPVIATWDDHDYGANDAGAEYPRKKEAQAIFLDFFQEPADSERRKTPGVYTAYYLEPGERSMQLRSTEQVSPLQAAASRIQILLLDTRYFRDPLATAPDSRPGRRHYIPFSDPERTLLGQAQWQWLKAELRQPADIRVIVSSIQVLPVDHRGERWDTFPEERRRLLALLQSSRQRALLLLSGDRHYGEISVLPAGIQAGEALPYDHSSAGAGDLSLDLYEITSSSLTSPWQEGARSPNRFRLANTQTHAVPNFGLLSINWTRRFLRAELRGESAAVLENVVIPF